jgi:hypothetical protein
MFSFGHRRLRLAVCWVLGLAAVGLTFLWVQENGLFRSQVEGQSALPPRAGPDGTASSPSRTLPSRDKGKKPTVEELRKRFPFESLADRLQYEVEAGKELGTQPAPRLSKEAAEKLKQADQHFESLKSTRSPFGPIRLLSLKALHSAEAEAFVKREGNGLERMPSPSPRYLDLAVAPTIPFESVSYPVESLVAETRVTLPARGTEPVAAGGLPSLQLLNFFHDAGRYQFTDPNSLGYVKDREHVAGFLAHRLSHRPEIPRVADPKTGKPKDKERWAMRRLELVSLLKSRGPGVYISDELPRMEYLKGVPRRGLDTFEAEALKRLRDGEDVVVEATTNRIRMLGSLRASKQCLECHRRQHGDLLGAFTYEFLRDPLRVAE